jgi:hypothetical protein
MTYSPQLPHNFVFQHRKSSTQGTDRSTHNPNSAASSIDRDRLRRLEGRKSQHAFKREFRQALRLRMHGDTIHNFARREMIEAPRKMRLIDPVHGGAKALAVAQNANIHTAFGCASRNAIHEMHFRANSPS